MQEIIKNFSIYFIPIMFGVIIHEVAHGWMAEKLGDPTARVMGRISLNPVVHVSLFGTIILPAFLLIMKSPILFGWAKPVPVDFNRLRHGRKGMAMVAVAGPLSNFIIAALSAIFYHLLLFVGNTGILKAVPLLSKLIIPLILMCAASVNINIILMVLNLIPIPPLDGGRIVVGLLPEEQARLFASIERYGMIILIFLLFSNLLGKIISPVLSFFINFFIG
ncbi:MAG TPA: site-2 protease family protein [Deltaproteobacteria bacterium]|nr:MAG: site-2 protease family protein [Deltaproteobacteria bacterium]HDM78808.1 site-2 protease family protein [Deltaproteobacteria bacterium]